MSSLVVQQQIRGASYQLESGAISSQRPTSEVHRLKNVTAQAKKIWATAVARSIHLYRNDLLDPAGTRSHNNDAVAHVDGFIDVMSNKQHGSAPRLPKAQHFILHTHPGKGIERAEWFVEQENFRVVDERSRESNALGHTPGKMVRISVAKCFEAHEPHEFVHLISFLAQHSTRDETGLDVAANGEPGKQIGVLKDETTLGARTGNFFFADEQFASIRKIETGGESKQRRFSTTARPD